MTDEELDSWIKFKSLTICQLNDSGIEQTYVSLKIDPSFDIYERLYVSKEANKFDWSYIAWDSKSDYQKYSKSRDERLKLKFGKFQPKLMIIRGELDVNFYQETEKKIKHLKLIPLIENDDLGLDGTNYQISIGNYLREVTYSWWNNLPEEWSELEFIFTELYKNMEIARKEIISSC